MKRGNPVVPAVVASAVVTSQGKRAVALQCKPAKHPAPDTTLGAICEPVEVVGRAFGSALLRITLDRALTVGIEPHSTRVFRYAADEKRFVPVWDSGASDQLGIAWATITVPGVYVAIGLPRDRLLCECLRALARERRLAGDDTRAAELTRSVLGIFHSEDAAQLQHARAFLTRLEFQTGLERLDPRHVEMDNGGHVKAFCLPRRMPLERLKKQLLELRTPPGGLPEEQLFGPLDDDFCGTPPWPLSPQWQNWDGIPLGKIPKDSLFGRVDLHWLWPWLFSKDWWMYQHDRAHTGHVSGPSDIRRTSASRLHQLHALSVDGPIITKPVIVGGKIYVGSGRQGGTGGTLYKFDLHTGVKEGELPTTGVAFYGWYAGIGGSPAVTGGRVYFTGVHGKVYCVDAASMTPSAPHPAPLWETDLSVANAALNQPVNQPDADCWSGPLVVDDKVYIGCGEGESPTTYGFIYCLDANTGHVLWLFCTKRFNNAAQNSPNTIPTAVAAAWAAGAGFTVATNPPETGCAVWSSCAYDAVLNRIYVGTGNSQYPHTAQPDEQYGSGLISLDADTGAFRAFFQPTPDDSYWPGDSDIDVPGSPTVITRSGDRVVAFGSKNGSFFLLDPDTLVPVARRQLLPRVGGSGLPGDRGTGIPAVVPNGGTGENSYGIFGTPSYHRGEHAIFVGLGGYNGMALDAGAGIDQTRTPFLRALDWETLADTWPTALGADGVSRYTTTKPPMYSTHEVALSSPAVVNDVVFVSTDKTGLYALAVSDGHCVWSASGLPTGIFALGPAIYGNYVVMGAGDKVYVYTLRTRFHVPFPYPIPWPRWPWPIPEPRPPWRIPRPDPPPPDPWEWLEAPIAPKAIAVKKKTNTQRRKRR